MTDAFNDYTVAQDTREIRRPKSEGRRKSEIRNSKPVNSPRNTWLFGFRISDFDLLSAFGLRISAFYLIMPTKTAIAIGAHPDDIEFYMAGTLQMLKKAGYKTHYLTLANGNCGSAEYDERMLRSIRNTEGRAAAKILGAQFHQPLTNDLEIIYSLDLLRKLAAIIREVKPGIVLTHSPQDYMEDHTNTSRLAVTAAFTRGMPNFKTVPAQAAAENETTVYHAMPHGLCDQLRRRLMAGAYVNTTSVHKAKHQALGAHKSQQAWLDVSQGLNSYLLAMEDMSLAVGRLSKKFRHAEGWRRHLHLGFCGPGADPLRGALGRNYLVNKDYERKLEEGV
jgi:LmbE family N-acetylglucosaminyl deacetylase